ncbi:hypothetical protein GCM10008171_26930 [Methylopila jiangsuensis]|uniref:CatB-related O-acetyltransferase n=1 Tax=Methylopila jiangsuensis TaxID=586230 RepID=A0A9W6N3V1_9HYPH|nr:CatB-related O-acetyltransferase [Methylopila jiangsuensis]MDR6285172.1 acetyltransferase-like isoleucine patch superfamily enzyme [Methylopila jiangsuensis]GLK77439.1 hypothetical protein GCM10008171_26930 [Methylopila jiangsuensis]
MPIYTKDEALKQLLDNGMSCAKSFNVPDSLQVELPCRLSDLASKHLTVGAFSYFGPYCDIRRGEIGRYCSFGRRVRGAQVEHPTDYVTTHPIAYNPRSLFINNQFFQIAVREREVKNRPRLYVGHDVWVGDGAFIRSGVTIGTGAIVGANSVVVHDVPPYAVVAGSPATIKRMRFDEHTVERLISSRWWEKDIRILADDIGNVSMFLDAIEAQDVPEYAHPKAICKRAGKDSYELKFS